MALLDIRQRTGYLFLAIVVGHIILISAQVNTARGVPMLEAVTFGVFAEIQRAASIVVSGAVGGWDEYIALRSVRSDNEQLKRDVAQLRIRLQQEQALAAQSRTYESLLALKSASTLETVAATVIAGGASPDFRTITVDKGADASLRPDLAVLAPEGIVGRVVIPSARAAKVQLLIDRNAAVGGLDERSRAQGVVVGTGDDRLRMDYVPGTADLKVGDRVVTSGIDGIYPKGFVIGQIESIERASGEYRSVTIRPAVDFSALEAVLVVLSLPTPAPEDLAPATSAAAAPARPAAPAPVKPAAPAPVVTPAGPTAAAPAATQERE